MIEVIILGRGGQGAVTAAQIIAVAAGYDGRESQAFPMFGVERRGAPVQAFARISDGKINVRSQVYRADYLIVLDPSLIDCLDVGEMLKNNATIIINSSRKCELKDYKTFNVDATAVALRIFGRDITNTMMVAAFAEFTKAISKEAVSRAISDVFSGDVARKNCEAVDEVCKVIRK